MQEVNPSTANHVLELVGHDTIQALIHDYAVKADVMVSVRNLTDTGQGYSAVRHWFAVCVENQDNDILAELVNVLVVEKNAIVCGISRDPQTGLKKLWELKHTTW